MDPEVDKAVKEKGDHMVHLPAKKRCLDAAGSCSPCHKAEVC